MHTTATALKNGWRAVELQNLLSAFPLRCRFFICQTQAFRCAFVFSFARPIPSAALSFFHLPDPSLSLRFRFFICQTHPLSLRFRFCFFGLIPRHQCSMFNVQTFKHVCPARIDFFFFGKKTHKTIIGSKPQQVVSNSHIIKTDHVKCQHQQHHQP